MPGLVSGRSRCSSSTVDSVDIAETICTSLSANLSSNESIRRYQVLLFATFDRSIDRVNLPCFSTQFTVNESVNRRRTLRISSVDFNLQRSSAGLEEKLSGNHLRPSRPTIVQQQVLRSRQCPLRFDVNFVKCSRNPMNFDGDGEQSTKSPSSSKNEETNKNSLLDQLRTLITRGYSNDEQLSSYQRFSTRSMSISTIHSQFVQIFDYLSQSQLDLSKELRSNSCFSSLLH